MNPPIGNKRKKIYVTGNIIITYPCNQQYMWCLADESYKTDADEIIEGDLLIYKKGIINENAEYYAAGSISQLIVYPPKSIDEAKNIYDSSIEDIVYFLNYEIKDDGVSFTRYKYSYIGVFATLEHFLCSICRIYIIQQEEYMEKFLQSNGRYKDKKFPLSEIFSEYKSIKESVDNYICDIVYHNTDTVQNIFKSVFNINVNMEQIKPFIPIRHDIVHRNGWSKDNNNTYVKKSLVSNLIECANDIVKQVYDGFKEKSIS